MSDRDNSQEVTANSKYSSNSETERVFNVFDGFKKDVEETSDTLVEEDTSQPVLTMSSIGKLGRFGNQLFQYAFLRICAEQSGAKVECPAWIGQTLFGHDDAKISRRLPAAIEGLDVEKNLFDIVPEFIPFLEKQADAKSSRIGSEALETGLANVDIWGFFQFHTRYFKPHQEYFRSLFQPVNDLQSALEDGLNVLRSQGKTIVGIHIRRGDYLKQPKTKFTLVFPTKWYCEWLDGIWNELEDPVLFLCSDELDSIIHDFEKFSPLTYKDLDIKLPERMKNLDIEFYIDFFMLSNCDKVITSNSNFSFVACMLNQRANMFIRPVWDFSKKFTVFDPWDSNPLLRLGENQTKVSKSLADIVYVTYSTLGIWATLKSIFIYLPKSIITGWTLRIYLGYQIQGLIGVLKSLLSILIWRSVW